MNLYCRVTGCLSIDVRVLKDSRDVDPELTVWLFICGYSIECFCDDGNWGI